MSGNRQMHDSSSVGGAPPALMVETEELRVAGNRLLELAASVAAARTTGMCHQTAVWGSPDASSAGQRFADRFGYLLGSFSDELDSAGHALRLSAEGYDYIDAHVAQSLATTDQP